MSMARLRATSADVVALAGVSRSTVSYVLSGNARHSFNAQTVERVRAAANQLGYTPHAATRALRKGESGVVLLALQDMPIAGNLGKLLSGLTDAVWRTGRSLLTWSIRPGVHLRDALRDINPQAILEIIPLPDDDRTAAAAAGIPIISTTGPVAHLDRAVGNLQVQHLAKAAYRQLGIATVDGARVGVFRDARRDGAREAAVALGLPLPLDLTLDAPDDATVQKAAETLRAWTALPHPVTAICCFNDLFAGVIIAAARSAGLGVPEDLSVIGVDDEPLGGFLQPTLTTVRYDFASTAAYAEAQLRAILNGEAPPQPRSSDIIELVERGSVAPPPMLRTVARGLAFPRSEPRRRR
jgi:DNA-binding LacI/PurR family transcriptional regulator